MSTENSCCAPTTAATSCCGSLTDREQALIALSASIALNNGDAVKQSIIAAKQVGVTNDEIGKISEVVTMLQGDGSGLTIEEMAAKDSSNNSSTCCR